MMTEDVCLKTQATSQNSYRAASFPKRVWDILLPKIGNYLLDVAL